MTINAELIAIGILGVSLVSLGWKVTGDLRQEIHRVYDKVTGDLQKEIHLVRKDVTVLGDRIDHVDHRIDHLDHRIDHLDHRIGNLDHRIGNLDHRIGNLEQSMARLEGWMEGRFIKQPELKAKPATSR